MGIAERIAVIAGICSFALLFLYDAVCVRYARRMTVLFSGGSLLLIAATLVLFIYSPWKKMFANHPIRMTALLIIAVAMLALLLKALFFSFPAQDAYASDGKAQTVTSGIYAFCRHPGVWFLSGFYLSVWIAFQTTAWFLAFVCFTILDVLLVYYEDRCVFIKILSGYEQYQKTTPFLIPKRKK